MQELQTLYTALDKANNAGAFNLNESGVILNAYQAVAQAVQELESLKAEKPSELKPVKPAKSK